MTRYVSASFALARQALGKNAAARPPLPLPAPRARYMSQSLSPLAVRALRGRCRGSTLGASATRLGSETWSGSLRATGKSLRWISRMGEAFRLHARPSRAPGFPHFLFAAWEAPRMRALSLSFPARSSLSGWASKSDLAGQGLRSWVLSSRVSRGQGPEAPFSLTGLGLIG